MNTQVIPNGSFETKADVFADAAYWQSYVASTGTVVRTNEAAAEGHWSVKIAGSGGWSLATTVLAVSRSFGAPMLIGELTPSLVGQRPDGLDWTTDVLNYANANGISWAYYHYREAKDQIRYLGLYEGPFGAPTDYGTGDAEILARVKAALVR